MLLYVALKKGLIPDFQWLLAVLRLGLTLLLLSLEGGCALAPGMVRDNDEVSDLTLPVRQADGKVSAQKIPITPITADLIIAREQALKAIAPTLPPQPEPGPYRIGPRDRLQITMWEHPELNDPGTEKIQPELAGKVVQDDGTIYYPYVGTARVAGMSVPEVRALLTRELSRSFKQVKLDVRVLAFESHKVYVVGEVKHPGIQSMVEGPLSVGEAISRAGGATPEADLSHVTLSRGDQLYPIDVLALYEQGNNAQNQYLKDGDVLNLPDRKQAQVYVTGEVHKQAALQINKGKMSLAQALSESSGVNFDTSNPEDIYVIRGAQAKPEIFHLDSESPDALILADRFPLQPHDVVYVGSAGVTRWSRAVNQLIPSTFGQIMTRGAFYTGF
jgi:polysaccharide export outer membrane protein